MSPSGDDDLLVRARSVLLDALEALAAHREAVVVIGAQALYLHTGAAIVALAEATKDSDIAIEVRALGGQPLLEEAMRDASFRPDVVSPDPGRWLSPDGIPVDLMVPEALAGPPAQGRRGARIPPHSRRATRRAVGLEATVIDHAPMEIRALDLADRRVHRVNVAGPGALLVAKLHKLAERRDTPPRLVDKDAHDIYRLLVAIPTDELAARMERLLSDDLAGAVTSSALVYLRELFADGPDAIGSEMAGRAEALIGDPAVVASSVAVLAQDLLIALG